MPYATSDLCQLADVKAWLDIAVSDTASDSILTRLIYACSMQIRQYCNRDLTQASYTEVRDGSGTAVMTMRNAPITAVASVTINGKAVQAAPNATGYGYVFDDYSVKINPGITSGSFNPYAASYNADGMSFPPGKNNVTVVYTAGFASVPQQIVQAAIELVSYKFRQRKHIGKKSENINTTGQGTAYQEGQFPPEVLDAIKPFRRVTSV